MVLPITAVSLLSELVQNRYVRTAAPAALGPSSCAFSNRPSTGRRPITVEERPADDTRFHHAWLAAETNQREVHRGEVTEGADSGDP